MSDYVPFMSYREERDEWQARACKAETELAEATKNWLRNNLDDKAKNLAMLNRALKAEAEVEIWRVAHRATDAARLKAEEEAHYANGVADLAMKHRNEAEEALRELLGHVSVHAGIPIAVLDRARAALGERK